MSTGQAGKVGQRPVAFRFYARNVQSQTMFNVDGDRVCGWEEAGAKDWSNKCQTWAATLTRVGDDSYILVNEHTGSFIVSPGNNGAVTLSHDNPDRAEAHWRFESLGQDIYRIVNVGHSNCVLDMAAGYNFNGVLIHSWDWHGGDNQKWIVTRN